MAQDQMFNPMNSMNAALLGPDILQKQYQMEQNKRYADLLQAQSMEPMNGQMVDGHYIAPSSVQGLSNMLRAYVSRKTMDDMPKQMSDLAQAQNGQVDNMFGLGGGNVPQVNASRMALGGGAQVGSVGPTVENANRMNNVQAGTGAAYPIPAGMDARLASTLYKIDPRKYAEALATHSTPTELQKTAQAAGFQPGTQAYQGVMAGNVAKQNYIAPVNAAPGATVLDPTGTRPLFNAPKDGIGINYGSNGPVGFSVPEFSKISAANAGAEADARNASNARFTPDKMIDTSTGDTVGTNALVTSGNDQSPNGKPPVLGLNPTVTKTQEGMNDDWLKNDYRPAIESSNSASNLVNTIKAMRGIDTTTGWGEGAKGTAASVLGALGVKDAATYAGKQEKFQALAMDRLQTELMKQKGPQTEGDAQRASQTFAKLENTPQANQFILDFAEAKARQDMRKAAFLQDAINLPGVKKNLTEINKKWNDIQGSIFADPIMSKYGVQ